MENTGCISQSQVLLQYFLAVDLLPEHDVLENCRMPAELPGPSTAMPVHLRASDFSR